MANYYFIPQSCHLKIRFAPIIAVTFLVLMQGAYNVKVTTMVLNKSNNNMVASQNATKTNYHTNINSTNDDDEVMINDIEKVKIYRCGYDKTKLFHYFFPEFKRHKTIVLNRNNAQIATKDDILVTGLGGYCDGWGEKKLGYEWFDTNFNGTVLHFNGEAIGGNAWLHPLSSSPPSKRQFHFGYGKQDGCQNIVIPFLSQFFFDQPSDFQLPLVYEHKKPHSSKERFLIYTASNCVDFRENAFATIATTINNNTYSSHDTSSRSNGTIVSYYGGRCSGGTKFDRNQTMKDDTFGKSNKKYRSNYLRMNKYRFCLVMENIKMEGYITEKILIAFMSGCIPIYYGDESVFDIFNPHAFIYYNISNPTTALNRIYYLESNNTAYDEVMNNEPILLNGNQTLLEYFFSNGDVFNNNFLENSSNVGNSLRKKIRKVVQGQGCHSGSNKSDVK